jgi:hypothetical protein
MSTTEIEQMWAHHAAASADPRTIAATQQLIERFEAQFTPKPPADVEWHGWIPLGLDYFYAGMLTALDELGDGRWRCLEVGSGIGTKLCLAEALGFTAVGIEFFLPYVEVSKELFPHVQVLWADAARYDGYADFDLVFGNRVAVERREQDRINRRISAMLKPGALFFCPSVDGPYPEWLEHVQGFVWRKDA